MLFPHFRAPVRRPRRPRGFRPQLEHLEERTLLTTFTVITAADNGDNVNPTFGSLRKAILDANNNPNIGVRDNIEFNIPGNTTIGVLSTLPNITDPVVINGHTQPGSQFNTSNLSENAVLPIELNGGVSGSTATVGLFLNAPNCLVAGLRINGFQGGGLFLFPSADHTTIIGNFIGVDFGNDFDGIMVLSDHNTIGGALPSDRNLISGNQGNGIVLSGDSNNVENNWIGRDAKGNALGNGAAGVLISHASSNTIGGPANTLQINYIAYNKEDGLVIDGNDSQLNTLSGNHIYVNGYNGVSLINGAQVNFIGGKGSDNTIVSNGYSGVSLSGGKQNFVSGFNAIYDNQVLGIKLTNGANQSIAAPQLSSAVFVTDTTITGTFHGKPNSGYELDFFANNNIPHWKDQGVDHLGAIGVNTDANGNATFTATFPGIQPLKTITATSGGSEGYSEFSAPVLANPAPEPSPPGQPVPPGQPSQPSGPTTDVTAQVSVRRFKLRRRADGTYRQKVTLTNTGAGALQGPVYLVLDGLTKKVKLKQRTGVTKGHTPAGSPYQFVNVGSDGVLQAGESRTVVLTFVNPLRRKVRYTPTVMAGAGAP